ncbi:MAG: DinB family protein [Actinomycetota bacterium]|nr:DinB family protein [Actinomycetota bacterium]
MDIAPDTKDWTWVLDRPCPDCGLGGRAVSGRDVAPMLRFSVAAWQDVLRGKDVRLRPAPSTWSPLEYACHVRDVCQRFDARLRLMLTRDDPDFENWDQDGTAIASRYGDQDPAVVAAELEAAAHSFAALLDSVSDDQWHRTGRRSDGAQFTVDSFARYFIHDLVHHLHDVGADRPAAPSRSG